MAEYDPDELQRAANLFQAMADPSRLNLLIRLSGGEASVGELARTTNAALGTVSARLKVLSAAELVSRRREGQTMIYALSDHHVRHLLDNALAHALGEACEVQPGRSEGDIDQSRNTTIMKHQHQHADHPHQHGPGCGHMAIRHGDHVDYIHDGHLHHQDGGTVTEHTIPVTEHNPAGCTADHPAGHAEPGHVHGPGCGHEAVPHGDHVDYVVDGRLHHPHGDHCDDHGPVEIVQQANA